MRVYIVYTKVSRCKEGVYIVDTKVNKYGVRVYIVYTKVSKCKVGECCSRTSKQMSLW